VGFYSVGWESGQAGFAYLRRGLEANDSPLHASNARNDGPKG
jgi:hypothetical protein